MTCDKCGKELEVINTDTGGAFLPCSCTAAAKLIAKVKDPECNCHWGETCSFCVNIINSASIKIADALEIAIETLKEVRSEMSSQNIDRLWCIDQISGSLEKINEVCK